MKKIKVFLIVSFLSTKLLAQSVLCNEWIHENGIKKDNDLPYSGPCVSIDEVTKIIEVRGAFKNGLKDGKWEFYSKDGKTITDKESYKDGAKDGRFEHYDINDLGVFVLYKVENYKQNKKHGTWEFYDIKSGKLWRIENYVDGEKNGEQIEFDRFTGSITHVSNLITLNGKPTIDGLDVRYGSDGLNDTISYKNGLKDGVCVKHFKNGQLEYRWIYTNGKISDGIQENYREDGFIASRIEYKDDIQNGIYERYWQGKLEMKGEMKMGKRHGRWEIYIDDKGNYLNGKFYKKKSGYYENGEKTKNL